MARPRRDPHPRWFGSEPVLEPDVGHSVEVSEVSLHPVPETGAREGLAVPGGRVELGRRLGQESKATDPLVVPLLFW